MPESFLLANLFGFLGGAFAVMGLTYFIQTIVAVTSLYSKNGVVKSITTGVFVMRAAYTSLFFYFAYACALAVTEAWPRG